MYQGTTPTIPLRFCGTDLSDAKIFLTIQDGKTKKKYTFTTPDDFTVQFDGQDTVGELTLTQEQTLAFDVGPAIAQARWVTSSGQAGITKEKNIVVNRAILKDVIQYGE